MSAKEEAREARDADAEAFGQRMFPGWSRLGDYDHKTLRMAIVAERMVKKQYDKLIRGGASRDMQLETYQVLAERMIDVQNRAIDLGIVGTDKPQKARGQTTLSFPKKDVKEPEVVAPKPKKRVIVVSSDGASNEDFEMLDVAPAFYDRSPRHVADTHGRQADKESPQPLRKKRRIVMSESSEASTGGMEIDQADESEALGRGQRSRAQPTKAQYRYHLAESKVKKRD